MKSALAVAVEYAACFEARGWPRGKTVHREFGYASLAEMLRAATERGVEVEKIQSAAKRRCVKARKVRARPID